MNRVFLALQLIIATSVSLTHAWKIQKQDVNEISSSSAAKAYQQIISQYKDHNSITETPLYVHDERAEKIGFELRMQKEHKILREILLDLQKQPGFEDLRMKFLKSTLALDEKMGQNLLQKVIKRAMKRIAKRLKYTRGPRKRLGQFGIGGFRRGSSLNGDSQAGGSTNSCPEGQIRRGGTCSCPYLSTWNTEHERCECIYGTYQDEQGNCRSFF